MEDGRTSKEVPARPAQLPYPPCRDHMGEEGAFTKEVDGRGVARHSVGRAAGNVGGHGARSPLPGRYTTGYWRDALPRSQHARGNAPHATLVT